MERVLYVATYGDFFASFQIENMKIWQSLGCEVHCAANFEIINYNRYTDKIDSIGIIKHNIPFVRTPYSLKNIIIYRELLLLMAKENITILDCHNPVPSILARTAAIFSGVRRVVYTVHGFFFYKGAPIKNNLFYKLIENIMARYTDYLIVSNIEDYEVAKKMCVRRSIYYVHGVGVDIEEISNLKIDIKKKRKELKIPDNAFVLCSVGECIKRKNHETSLRAFANLKMDNLYYIIVGDGELYAYLKELSEKLGVANRTILPGYRKDANEILKISDLYVFPSYQEGLSVALMQAMAARLPVVASAIRGNIDCIDNEKGGITVQTDDIVGWSKAIKKMIVSPQLCAKYGEYNAKKVQHFSKAVVQKENYEIFAKVLER